MRLVSVLVSAVTWLLSQGAPDPAYSIPRYASLTTT